jgi:hypothetical protein
MYRFLVLFLCSILITACSASAQVLATQTANTPIAAAETKTPTATATSPDVMPTLQAATATKEPTVAPTATETNAPSATATPTATATRRPPTRTFTPSGPTNTPLPTRTAAPTRTSAAPALAEGCPYPDRTGRNFKINDNPHKSAVPGSDQYAGKITSFDAGKVAIQYLDHYGNPVDDPTLPTEFAIGPAGKPVVNGQSVDVLETRKGERVPEWSVPDGTTFFAMYSWAEDGSWARYRSGCGADLGPGTTVFIFTVPGTNQATEILFEQ